MEEVDEDINGGEPWDGVPFMQFDCSLNVLVTVLLGGGVRAKEVFVESVVEGLDLGSSLQRTFLLGVNVGDQMS